MLKRITVFLLALTIMVEISASVGLAAGETQGKSGQVVKTEAKHREFSYPYESAAAAAKAEVPPDSILQGVMDDTDTVTFSFFDNNTLRSFEAVVLKSVNKVTELKIGGSNLPGSATITKTPQDIERIVLQEYPDAKNIVIVLKKEGNLSYYEASFETEKYIKADLKVNPVTGAFGSQKLQYKVDVPPVKDVQPENNPSQAKEEKPVVQNNPIPPVSSDWTCAKCGTVNHEGQFCTNCGTQRPAEAVSYACSKCGWKPKDPNNLPKFCPECGARFQN